MRKPETEEMVEAKNDLTERLNGQPQYKKDLSPFFQLRRTKTAIRLEQMHSP